MQTIQTIFGVTALFMFFALMIYAWYRLTTPFFDWLIRKITDPHMRKLEAKLAALQDEDEPLTDEEWNSFAEALDILPEVRRATCPVCGCQGDVPIHAPDDVCPCGGRHSSVHQGYEGFDC